MGGLTVTVPMAPCPPLTGAAPPDAYAADWAKARVPTYEQYLAGAPFTPQGPGGLTLSTAQSDPAAFPALAADAFDLVNDVLQG